MGAEELNHSQETMQQPIKDSWQYFGDDEADEETLSFCDLVMKSESNEFWSDDFSKDQDQQKGNDGDLFEFFSEDYFTVADSTFPEINNNNIIFCGKIISSRGNHPNIGDKSQSLNCKIKQENNKKKNINSSSANSSSCSFPWKISSHSFNKSRTFPSARSTKESEGESFNRSLTVPASGSNSKNNYGKFGDEKFDFSVKKVSILATPVKSRWYNLFAFGVGRFPMEIELKDMKMRQSRKSKAMKFQPRGGVGGQPENIKGDRGRRRSGNYLWRLLQGFKVEARI